MKSKIITILLILIFTCTFVSSASAENSGLMGKDETVYAFLGYDGIVNQIKVVSRERGMGADGGTYFESTSENLLPVTLKLNYFLDGKQLDAKELGGATGELRIDILVSQNTEVPDSLKNKFMMQLQVPVNLENAEIVSAKGASSIITGRLANLSYAVLPGSDEKFELLLKIKDFKMDSIQGALLKYDVNMPGSYNDLLDGLDEMGDKSGELVDGTKRFSDGMTDLSKGASDISNASKKLTSGASSLTGGIVAYGEGLNKYFTGVRSLYSGVQSAGNGLEQVNINTSAVEEGLKALAGAAGDLSNGHKSLVQLASKLKDSKDPELKALYEGLAAEAEGLVALNQGLQQSSKGFAGLSAGLGGIQEGMDSAVVGFGELSKSAEGLKKGYASLQDGYMKLAGGIDSLGKGMTKFADSTKVLPENANKIYDGQTKFRNGILEMQSKIKQAVEPEKNIEMVSFVDGATKVNSLQFIMKTPSIDVSEKTDKLLSSQVDQKSWIDRIWDKLVKLF